MTFEHAAGIQFKKNYREIMASKISSACEFHEDMERGQKEKSCFCKLQLLSYFLLAATLGRQITNLQTPGRDYSPSHFLLDVRIFKNSI